MPSALSVDLREQVIEVRSSQTLKAERLGVGKASVIRSHACFRDKGEIAPKPTGGWFPPAIKDQADTILESCRAHSQLFLLESLDTLAEQSIQISTSRVWRFFGRHGIIH